MIYLLVIEAGPTTLRIAERATAVSSDDGDLLFRGGLGSFDWESEWGLGAAIELEDLPVEIDGPAIDGPALRVYLALGIAEISRLDVDAGEAWESREVLLRGRISEPTIGAAGEPVSFAVRRITGLSDVLDPPASMVVGSPELAALGLTSTYNTGQVIPVVFGEPGFGDTPGSIALHVKSDPSFPEYAIAAHPVAATTVEVSDLLDDGSGTRTWYTAAIESGFPSLISSASTSGGAKIAVRWTGGGSMLRPASALLAGASTPEQLPVRTAGELIERQLWTNGDCDRGRTAAAVGLLPHRVDGYYDAQVNPIEWLKSNVLPIFPVSLNRGPRGWYPVVWRGWLANGEPTEDFSAGRADVVRVGDLVADGSDNVINEVRVRFGLDADLREYRRQLTVTGEVVGTPSPSRVHNELAGFSYQLLGAVLAKSVDTEIVYRRATASQIAAWMLARWALPSWVGEYDLHQRHRYKVTPGDVILLTDSEMGLEAHPASVEQVVDSMGATRIRIRTIESMPGR